MRRLGLAVAATFARENIREAVVGRDVRPSSDSFFEALSEGLTRGGVSVIDIGVVPTPVFYFAAKKWGIPGGVMITASHNPSEFNGFKVLRGEGTIYGADILELRDVAAAISRSREAAASPAGRRRRVRRLRRGEHHARRARLLRRGRRQRHRGARRARSLREARREAARALHGA